MIRRTQGGGVLDIGCGALVMRSYTLFELTYHEDRLRRVTGQAPRGLGPRYATSGIPGPDRGQLSPEIWQTWRDATRRTHRR